MDTSKSFPKVESLKPFNDFKLKLGSKVNLDKSSLDLEVALSLKETVFGDYIEITVPNELKMGTLSCAPMMCSNVDGKIKVEYMTSIMFNLQIQGITNPESTKPIGPFSIFAFDSQGRSL